LRVSGRRRNCLNLVRPACHRAPTRQAPPNQVQISGSNLIRATNDQRPPPNATRANQIRAFAAGRRKRLNLVRVSTRFRR
jgi:hypothetical protein